LYQLPLCYCLVLQLGAQPKEVQNLLKNYEKTKQQTENPKRADKARYVDSLCSGPHKSIRSSYSKLVAGLSSLEARVILKDQRALSTEYKTVQGE